MINQLDFSHKWLDFWVYTFYESQQVIPRLNDFCIQLVDRLLCRHVFAHFFLHLDLSLCLLKLISILSAKLSHCFVKLCNLKRGFWAKSIGFFLSSGWICQCFFEGVELFPQVTWSLADKQLCFFVVAFERFKGVLLRIHVDRELRDLLRFPLNDLHLVRQLWETFL